jgi:hypothetical protein
MDTLLPNLPSSSAWVVFGISFLAGAFVIVMYCVDRFEKLDLASDERDPWKFVVPRYLTPPEQYIIGFLVYCVAMLLIFAIISLLGPQRIFEIVTAAGGDAPSDKSLGNFATFPIVVAFILVGLNPSLHLPKSLDFEILIRHFAHRIAYIPKNMDRIFNHMRFSEFDLNEERLAEAWSAVDLERPKLDAPDLKALAPLLDRAVLLYVRAAALAGDLPFDGAGLMAQNLALDVFKQYRAEIGNVASSLQVVQGRLSDFGGASAGDRRKAVHAAQQELIRNLEFLYVIFACAIAAKSMDRIAERLREVGFTSPFPPNQGIPWDPVLKTLAAAAAILLVAFMVAAQIFADKAGNSIPKDTWGISYSLFAIVAVHLVAVWQALRGRSAMIRDDRYFAETGQPQAVAFVKIFFRCYAACLAVDLLLWLENLLAPLRRSEPVVQTVGIYLEYWAIWAIVPALCGTATAYVLDRPADTYSRRASSGAVVGIIMAVAAVVAVRSLDWLSPAFPVYQAFSAGIYGALGFVIGFQLPAGVRRYWAALENGLPDRIVVLRTSVREYFRDIQQFTEWLNTHNDRLEGKRPVDLLAQDTGVQQLVSFVAASRPKLI